MLLLSELCVVGLTLLTNTHFKVAKATCFQCIESWVVERVLSLPLVASTVLEIEKALPLKGGRAQRGASVYSHPSSSL